MSLEIPELMHMLAEQHCNRGDLDCRWYHGNWQLLKSLGVVSTSAVHATELGELLERAGLTTRVAPNVLLSGSTDATLLEILASCAPGGGRHADITGVDICATPLELMGLYARARGITFSPYRADILDYPAHNSFDIILTHAFMGNFDTEGRAALARKWASMLSATGSIVTVQRVRPADSPPVIRFSAEQARQFIHAVLTAAQASDLSPDDLARAEAAASAFAENFMSHAITSKASLEQVFIDAGLTFSHLEYRSLDKRVNLAGPSVPSGGEYAFIIAERGKSV